MSQSSHTGVLSEERWEERGARACERGTNGGLAGREGQIIMTWGKYNVILSCNEVCCQLYDKGYILFISYPLHPLMLSPLLFSKSLFPLHFLFSLPAPLLSCSLDWLIEVVQQHLMAFEILLYSCWALVSSLYVCVCVCVCVCVLIIRLATREWHLLQMNCSSDTCRCLMNWGYVLTQRLSPSVCACVGVKITLYLVSLCMHLYSIGTL